MALECTLVGAYQISTSSGTISNVTIADLEETSAGLTTGSCTAATFTGATIYTSFSFSDTIELNYKCEHCDIKMRGAGRLCKPCKDMSKKKIIEFNKTNGKWEKPHQKKPTTQIQGLKFDPEWTLINTETQICSPQPAMFALGVEDTIVAPTEETVTTTLTYASSGGTRIRKQIYVNGVLQEETLTNQDGGGIGGNYVTGTTCTNWNNIVY